MRGKILTLEKRIYDEKIVEPNVKSKIESYSLHNLSKLPYYDNLTEEQLEAIKVVGTVLPFKTNNYVIDHLIDWENFKNDPMFILNFPQKGMLIDKHYNKMKAVLDKTKDHLTILETANSIRKELNPHPAEQKQLNVPTINGERLEGAQHKYRETLLFFPKQGQTCHAYCSFCFRWPQFVGLKDLRFANKHADQLVDYVIQHDEIQDVLFTGGDPMVMKNKILKNYIKPLIEAGVNHIKTIRIGTKSLSYWPYRYTTDKDASELLDLFQEISDSGIHLAIMSHFNHPNELSTPVLAEAVRNIRETGAQIRTQSPILKNINDSADVWSTMWRKQVDLGMIPYYMFVVRDTGARHYFELPLIRAWNIFHNAYKRVSGICRTVRGPSMSASPGKIQVVGPTSINNHRIIVLRFIQGRNPDWVNKPFFAKYDEKAMWLDDLKPLEGDKFFFENKPGIKLT